MYAGLRQLTRPLSFSRAVVLSLACGTSSAVAAPALVPGGLEPTVARLDSAALTPIFGDADAPPDLREAWVDLQRGRWRKARTKFAAFVDAHPTHPLTPYAGYLLARILRRSGQHQAAARRFAEVAARSPDLADHARYHGARAAFRARLDASAAELAWAVAPDSHYGPRASVLAGRALARLGRHADAVKAFDRRLAGAEGGRDADATRVARALSLAESGEPWPAARELYRIWLRRPKGEVGRDAGRALSRLRPRLGRRRARALPANAAANSIRRAHAALGRNHARAALRFTRRKSRLPALQACEIDWIEAKAYTLKRGHDEAAPRFARFAAECADDPRVAEARFAAGRAHWTRHRNREALEQFRVVTRDFPDHELADDALLNAARILHQLGDSDGVSEAVARLAREYPLTDSAADAHWLRFELLWQEGEFDAAAAHAAGHCDVERDAQVRGRLAYFEGRALERAGNVPTALLRYVNVVLRSPMHYYALLALNRLRALAPTAFRTLHAGLVTGRAIGIEVRPHRLAEDPDFRAAVAFVRLGLIDEAHATFEALRRGWPERDVVRWTEVEILEAAGATGVGDHLVSEKARDFGGAWPVHRARGRYEAAFPIEYRLLVDRWSRIRELDRALVYAVIREESGFEPRANSWANACGLMQLVVPTARAIARGEKLLRPDLIGCSRLFDAPLNIRLGTALLGRLNVLGDHHPGLVIAAYQAGSGKVRDWIRRLGHLPFDLWLESIPYPATRQYTKRVLTAMWAYRWLLGDPAVADSTLVPLPLELAGREG